MPPLKKQLLPVPLAVGENLGADPAQSKALQQMINCYINRDGEIQKRPGTVPFTAAGANTEVNPFTSAYGLFPSQGNGPIVIADTTQSGSSGGIPPNSGIRAWGSPGAASGNFWQDRGRHIPFAVSQMRGSAANLDQVAAATQGTQVAETPLQVGNGVSGAGFRIVAYQALGQNITGKITFDLYAIPGGQPIALGNVISMTYPFFVFPFQDYPSANWSFMFVGIVGSALSCIKVPLNSASGFYPPNLTTTAIDASPNTSILSACAFQDTTNNPQLQWVCVLYQNSANTAIKLGTIYSVANVVTTAKATAVSAATGVNPTAICQIGRPGTGNFCRNEVAFSYIDGANHTQLQVSVPPDSNLSYSTVATLDLGAQTLAANVTAMSIVAEAASLPSTERNLTVNTVSGGNTNPYYIVMAQSASPVPSGSAPILSAPETQFNVVEYKAGSASFPTHTAFLEYNAQLIDNLFVHPVTKSVMCPFGYVDESTDDAGVLVVNTAISWLSELEMLDSNAHGQTWLNTVANLQPQDAGPPTWQSLYSSPTVAPVALGSAALLNSITLYNAGAFFISLPLTQTEHILANAAPGSNLAVPAHSLLNTGPIVQTLTIPAIPPQYAALPGGGLLLAGATPQLYAGYITEHSFLRPPELILAQTAVAGSLTANGIYFYIASYEWSDEYGNKFTSASSRPRPITLGMGKSSAAVSLRALSQPKGSDLSGQTYPPKRRDLNIAVWRSTSAASGAYLYYRIGDYTTAVSGFPNGTPNVLTADTTPLVDGLADTKLTAQPFFPDPATTGIQAPGCLPPVSLVCTHKNRVFAVSSTFPTQIWPSNPILPETGLTFCPSLIMNINDGGAITGLAAQDAYVVVGKRNGIWVFAGPGPDSTGNGAWGEITKISSDTGVRDSNSMVSWSTGTIYKSDRGYYRFDRNSQSQYIGRPVQHRNSHSCLRGLLMPTVPQIRFLEDDGTVLVYDYEHNAWSEYTYSGLPAVVKDICVVGTSFYLLTGGSTPQVFVEDQTGNIWTDNNAAGNSYAMSVQTPWVNLAGVNGFQRCWWAHFEGTLPAVAINPNIGLNWAQSTNHFINDYVLNGSNIYICTANGTTASTGTGPAGTGTGIVDGTCTWNFVEVLQSFKVQLLADYSNTPVSTHQLSPNGVRARIKPLQQKCTAISAFISDQFDTYANPSNFTLSSMELVLASKDGKLAPLESTNTR